MLTFVDTGAWYARIVPRDPHHGAIVGWIRSSPATLITSDYVIDETLTLLRSRGEQQRGILLGRQFFDLAAYSIHPIDEVDLRRAWQLYRQVPNSGWSFTDCTSRAVIERLHIKHALSFDEHFRQFPGLEVFPK